MCPTFQGPSTEIDGFAYIKDATQPAKLSVEFFNKPPLEPNYWIMDLGPLNAQGLYSYALVGNGPREACYILNREPTMDAATLNMTMVGKQYLVLYM